MKHFLRLLPIALLFATIFTFTSARPASAACVIMNMDGPIFGTVDIVPGHTFIITFSFNGVTIPGYPLTAVIPTTPQPYGVASGFHLLVIDVNCDSTVFKDGRINNQAADSAQTAAIYCAADGGVTIWSVKDSVGKFAFTATRQEIDAVPKNPAKNTLIKQAKNIALYRLTSGELQVNAPNNYVYIWKDC